MWGGAPPLIAKDRIVFSVFQRPGAPRPLRGAFLSCFGKKGSKEADRGGAELLAPASKAALPRPFPARSWEQRESFQNNLPQKRYRAEFGGNDDRPAPCDIGVKRPALQITICLLPG